MFKISTCVLNSGLVTPCTPLKYTYSMEKQDLVWIMFQIDTFWYISTVIGCIYIMF